MGISGREQRGARLRAANPGEQAGSGCVKTHLRDAEISSRTQRGCGTATEEQPYGVDQYAGARQHSAGERDGAQAGNGVRGEVADEIFHGWKHLCGESVFSGRETGPASAAADERN